MAHPNPPFDTARKYYEWAWRPVIRAQRPRWKEPMVRRNLAWLWASRDQAEDDACQQLAANQAVALPLIDPTLLPARSVRKNEIPHHRSFARLAPPVPVPVAQPLPPPPPPPPPPGPPAQVPVVGVSVATQTAPLAPVLPPPPPPVNTTAFPFWPGPATGNTDLPWPDDDDDEWLRRDTLLYTDTGEDISPDEESRWHGVCKLGQGATGRAGLWVRVNELSTIDARVAIKDTQMSSVQDWANPMQWRDQLPRDIAIQERLKAQGGRPSVHAYRGFRLSMHQKQYRLFHEVCDYTNLMLAMEYYSTHWRRRRNHFRWVELHGEQVFRRDAQDAEDEAELFDDMSGIEDWSGHVFPAARPPDVVIPEAFLWAVFRDLVDACIFLARGATPLVDMGPGKDWRPIVHSDMHLQNIFVKPPATGGDGTAVVLSAADRAVFPLPDVGREEGSRFADFDAAAWPQTVLADFDLAFFDLQAPGDVYADNPSQYRIAHAARSDDDGGNKYPPELYGDYDGPMSKLDSSTDIWGIGQMMWNLLLNLPSKRGFSQEPFFDADGTEARYLVNGTPYTNEELDAGVLAGAVPYDAPRRYSNALKDLVRQCLRYDKEQRPALEELRDRIAGNMMRPPEDQAAGPLRVVVPGGMQEMRIGGVYVGAKYRLREGE